MWAGQFGTTGDAPQALVGAARAAHGARAADEEHGAERQGELHCRVVQSRSEELPAAHGLSERLARVGRMIDGGRLTDARIELEQSQDEPAELVELMRLKWRVVAREIEPSTALSRIVAVLERDPRHPAAMSIYRQLSLLQYEEGKSCASFSHPPPRGR